LTKEPKKYDGEKIDSSTNDPGKTGYLMQKTETRFMSSLCASINSMWIKYLNIRPETLKLCGKEQGRH
jgi:hypothetical protein